MPNHMRQLLLAPDGPHIATVPIPVPDRGELLIRVSHSVLSPGTEIAHMRVAKKSLLSRAIEDPRKLVKAVSMLRKSVGANTAYRSISLRNMVRPLDSM